MTPRHEDFGRFGFPAKAGPRGFRGQVWSEALSGALRRKDGATSAVSRVTGVLGIGVLGFRPDMRPFGVQLNTQDVQTKTFALISTRPSSNYADSFGGRKEPLRKVVTATAKSRQKFNQCQ